MKTLEAKCLIKDDEVSAILLALNNGASGSDMLSIMSKNYKDLDISQFSRENQSTSSQVSVHARPCEFDVM